MAVFCVGQWCCDIVTECAEFPVEDSDANCKSIDWCLGGNCCNMTRVMRYLGVPDVHYVGAIGSDDQLLMKFFRSEMEKCGVCMNHCAVVSDCSLPTTVALLSASSGSRTLMHTRGNLPQISSEQFENVPLDAVRWIHFECTKNVEELLEMLSRVRRERKSAITVSLEIEKSRPGAENLIPYADYIFISREYALDRDCKSMQEAAEKFAKLIPAESSVIVPWGSEGAAAKSASSEEVICSPASSPETVVDTLGAGDTFNGSFIAAKLNGQSLERSLEFACRVAGYKCGHRGYACTAELSSDYASLGAGDSELNE